jgi:hypothetical protein
MLTNFAKIFKKIIKSRLVNYLENNNLLSKNQYGFKSGLGTDNALDEVAKFLYENLDNGKKVFAVFLDLAKAFDTIHHVILSKILLRFSINNISINWFNSYVSNRKQIVKLYDSLCEEKIVTYAGDTCLLFSDNSWEEVNHKTIKEFNLTLA